MPTSALQHEYYMADLLIQSNVSAVSDSDVGDQYMFITILTDFQYVIDLPLFPTSEWQLMINVFLCLPLALLPLIIPVNAIASNWLFLMMCPTNWICLLTIIFRRFLDVLALWSICSFDTLSVHAIRNVRCKNHISVASNCDFILWLTAQLSHRYTTH